MHVLCEFFNSLAIIHLTLLLLCSALCSNAKVVSAILLWLRPLTLPIATWDWLHYICYNSKNLTHPLAPAKYIQLAPPSWHYTWLAGRLCMCVHLTLVCCYACIMLGCCFSALIPIIIMPSLHVISDSTMYMGIN